MPTTPPPNLGYGQASEVSLDHFNQYMRATPWYQSLIKSFGQDPNNVHLNDAQKQAVVRAAQANGAVIDEGKQEVDDSGNFRGVGHKLRNTLIVAGLAAATIATMGAAGAFSGAAGGAMAGGSAAGGTAAAAGGTAATAGGLLASTTTVPLMAGTIAGSVASGAVPVALAAGGTAATAGTLGSTVGNYLTSQAGSTALSTAGNIFTNIYGAKKAADANTHAADLQDAATQRAEQFAREQAEGAYQSNEHTQHANYDQWRARQDAIMGSLGHQLGITYTAPEYSPGIDPRYTGGATTPTPAGPANPAGDPQAFIANWQRTHDPKEGIAPLAAAYKQAGFGDRFLVNGTTPSNNELVVGGQKFKVLSGENGANPSWYIPGTNDSGPVARPTLATTFVRPNYMPLPTPYQPGTLGAYVGS